MTADHPGAGWQKFIEYLLSFKCNTAFFSSKFKIKKTTFCPYSESSWSRIAIAISTVS